MRGSCERFVVGLLSAALLSTSACGTLLYPERHGQRTGRVDPAVLLIDGALLLLFVIPGVVAYGIDFHTGAIYLPAGGKVSILQLSPQELDPERIEDALRAHTGLPLRLDDPRLEIRVVERGLDPDIAVSRALAASSSG